MAHHVSWPSTLAAASECVSLLGVLHPLLLTHSAALPVLPRVVRLLICLVSTFILNVVQHVEETEAEPDADADADADADSEEEEESTVVHTLWRPLVALFTPLDVHADSMLLFSLSVPALSLLLSSPHLTASSEATHYAVVYRYLQRHALAQDECQQLLQAIRWIQIPAEYLRDLLLHYSPASTRPHRDMYKHAAQAIT